MARDKFHYEVRSALEKEGWRITDDPLVLKSGNITIQIDLGAETLLGAEREGERIAVEVKTFGKFSFTTYFYEAVGQFIVYRNALELQEIDRVIYLALPYNVFVRFEEEPLVRRVIQQERLKLIIYDQDIQNIIKWIK